MSRYTHIPIPTEDKIPTRPLCKCASTIQNTISVWPKDPTSGSVPADLPNPPTHDEMKKDHRDGFR